MPVQSSSSSSSSEVDSSAEITATIKTRLLVIYSSKSTRFYEDDGTAWAMRWECDANSAAGVRQCVRPPCRDAMKLSRSQFATRRTYTYGARSRRLVTHSRRPGRNRRGTVVGPIADSGCNVYIYVASRIDFLTRRVRIHRVAPEAGGWSRTVVGPIETGEALSWVRSSASGAT